MFLFLATLTPLVGRGVDRRVRIIGGEVFETVFTTVVVGVGPVDDKGVGTPKLGPGVGTPKLGLRVKSGLRVRRAVGAEVVVGRDGGKTKLGLRVRITGAADVEIVGTEVVVGVGSVVERAVGSGSAVVGLGDGTVVVVGIVGGAMVVDIVGTVVFAGVGTVVDKGLGLSNAVVGLGVGRRDPPKSAPIPSTWPVTLIIAVTSNT